MPVDYRDSRMCSVCHQVLVKIEDLTTGRISWQHTGTQPSGCVLFIPLPVVPDQLATFCDFCSTPTPRSGRWVARCEPFGHGLVDEDTGQLVGALTGDDGQWDACEVCADLIRAGQWDELTEHAVWCFTRKHPDVDDEQRQQLKDDLVQLHGAIRRGFIRLEEA